jgi:hypothetical protein
MAISLTLEHITYSLLVRASGSRSLKLSSRDIALFGV